MYFNLNSQIGQQNLAFGLKFSAKGVVDCYEQEFEVVPYGLKRDIEFKMIEGDFEVFEGKWSIEQVFPSLLSFVTHLFLYAYMLSCVIDF